MKLRNNKTYISDVTREPKKEMDIEIDFDEASREWRRNKYRYGQGCFRYLKRSDRLRSTSIHSRN